MVSFYWVAPAWIQQYTASFIEESAYLDMEPLEIVLYKSLPAGFLATTLAATEE